MPLNKKYKAIFIHIPKCAGTSIKVVLEMYSHNHFVERDATKKKARQPDSKFTGSEYLRCILKSPQHFTLRELKKILPEETWAECKKFSVVRNPYDRFISEYKYRPDFRDKTLNEFISYIKKLNPVERNWLFDGHLETQSSFLINEHGDFGDLDKIYRFENLDECKIDLLKITGKNGFPHDNKSKIKDNYLTYYTPEIEEFVYNTYKDDFLNLNYDRMKLNR